MNSQYLHVSQFYEAILCFSLLLLIGQKIIILCKDLNEQYLKSRAIQFDNQIDWKKSFQIEKQMAQTKKQQQKLNQNQSQNLQPKRQTLKTSLMENSQSHQTHRNLVQGQQQPNRLQQQKQLQTQFTDQNRSLPQIKAQKIMQSQNKEHRKSMQRKSYESKQPIQQQVLSQTQKQKYVKIQSQNQNAANQNNYKSSVNHNQLQMKSQKVQNKSGEFQNAQPQLTQDALQKQYKDKQKIRYFKRIDSLFNQYFSIIIPVLFLGILVHSTYIFTMVCFFGFIFTSLLFNYANLLSKLKFKPEEDSIFMKTNKLVSGLFVIALFISYWADNQYI